MKRCLFLNLVAFSGTGGIERFNRCFLKAMNDMDVSNVTNSKSFSVYDSTVLEQYFPPDKYTTFNKRKLAFAIHSITNAWKFDVIFIGHINLAIVGLAIKRLFPAKKVYLIAHGIEVWSELSGNQKQLLKTVDAILTVSKFTKSKLIDVHSIVAEKIILFPNTINPFFNMPDKFIRNEDVRDKLNISSSDFVLYTLTRIRNADVYKGYDNVITALQLVKRECRGIKYVISGVYDPRELIRVEALINQLGLTDNVIITGPLKEDELVQHYQAADLFIMPSKKEGFGIVFIEAMVCGVPVIAGNVDGSVDALLDGRTGTLVNPDNVNEIAEAILKHINGTVVQNNERKTAIRKETLAHYSFESFRGRLKDIITCSN